MINHFFLDQGSTSAWALMGTYWVQFISSWSIWRLQDMTMIQQRFVHSQGCNEVFAHNKPSTYSEHIHGFCFKHSCLQVALVFLYQPSKSFKELAINSNVSPHCANFGDVAPRRDWISIYTFNLCQPIHVICIVQDDPILWWWQLSHDGVKALS